VDLITSHKILDVVPADDESVDDPGARGSHYPCNNNIVRTKYLIVSALPYASVLL
jgi:hypothetical protein